MAQFDFPLSPLFFRAFWSYAQSLRPGIASWRVACPVGTGVWCLASFGAGPPQRGLLPGLAAGAPVVWGSPLPPLPLFASFGWGAFWHPRLSDCLPSLSPVFWGFLFLSHSGAYRYVAPASPVLLSPVPVHWLSGVFFVDLLHHRMHSGCYRNTRVKVPGARF